MTANNKIGQSPVCLREIVGQPALLNQMWPPADWYLSPAKACYSTWLTTGPVTGFARPLSIEQSCCSLLRRWTAPLKPRFLIQEKTEARDVNLRNIQNPRLQLCGWPAAPVLLSVVQVEIHSQNKFLFDLKSVKNNIKMLEHHGSLSSCCTDALLDALHSVKEAFHI